MIEEEEDPKHGAPTTSWIRGYVQSTIFGGFALGGGRGVPRRKVSVQRPKIQN